MRLYRETAKPDLEPDLEGICAVKKLVPEEGFEPPTKGL